MSRSKVLTNRFFSVLLGLLTILCTMAAYPLTKASAVTSGKCTPPDGKTLLIVGQDLKSTWDYVQSGYFPTPSGITSYVNLYNLDGLQGANDYDWGAGPLNTEKCVTGYPNSVTVIGLYMTEQYNPSGLTDIVNGRYDTQINTLATFIKNANRPVYLRIGYEFDGQWNGYDPAKYREAFKYIVNKIRPVTTNFVSVWQASTSPINLIVRGISSIDISQWYPGDQYVDWCGLSWFLSNDSTQVNLANQMLTFARDHGKPVMICESTPQGYDLNDLTHKNISPVYDGTAGQNSVSKTPDQIWNEWFVPYFNYIHNNSDVIRAVAYINADWDSQAKWASPYPEGYWGDTRVQMNSTIRQKWINELNSGLWLHGSSSLFSTLFNNPPVSIKTITVDTPSVGQTVSGTVNVSGWAVHDNGSSGTGVDQVHVYLDGESGSGVGLGVAQYGIARLDVSATLGNSKFTNCGYSFSWNTSSVSNGSHTLYVYAHSTTEGWWIQKVPVNVSNGSPITGNKYLYIDSPTANQTVSGTVNVSGWAAHDNGSSGTGVDQVHVYMDGEAGNGGVGLGVAQYGISRQDVANAFGKSSWLNSGYNFSWNTSGVSNGTHKLYVYAHSTTTGWWISTVTVNVSNGTTPPPSGNINVPGVAVSNVGAIANGSSKYWDLNVTQAGNYKVLITSTSSQNSQLIDVSFNGTTVTQALDSNKTITVYFNNVSAGTKRLTITAKSSAVSIGKVELQKY